MDRFELTSGVVSRKVFPCVVCGGEPVTMDYLYGPEGVTGQRVDYGLCVEHAELPPEETEPWVRQRIREAGVELPESLCG